VDSNDLQDLPEEVLEAMRAPEQLSKERLELLGTTLAEKRDESVKARKESGIEDVWAAAEDAYLGIDDTNRGEFAKAKWAKPNSSSGPLTTNGGPRGGEVKSTVFVRLTSRYVDAGAAKVGEILLPVDDKPFSFDATPVPDLIAGKTNNAQVTINGSPAERDPRPGEIPVQPGTAPQPMGGSPVALPAGPAQAVPGSSAPGVPLTVKDLAEEAVDFAQRAAKRAEKRIADWMAEAQYPAEMRKVIFDTARIGVGVLRGPFPEKRVSRAAEKDPQTGRVVIRTKTSIVPSYEWRDPWNIFPDRACGENIQNGEGLFDRDFLSYKQLRALKGTPGYIETAINKVLEEGPKEGKIEAGNPSETGDRSKHRFTVWYYYGSISRADLLAAGSLKAEDQTAERAHAICTLVNDTVIRAVLSPLESGEFPYHAVPWQRRAGHWAGVGIGEQIAMPQRMINAATRTMMNNAGKSAGSITVLDRGSVEPADTNWALTPDKLFFKKSDATTDDVRKAFAFFQIPNATPQLMSIVEYSLRLAEESTSIPLVTQGQSGPTQPETFGATQLQNNNANQLLRSIGYSFDDCITEPVVLQSYEMLLLDDSVPDDEKGDWTINAHGSTAFVERAIQDQTIQAMGAFVKDPAYGTNPKKWFAEFMRTKHLNPTVFQYTPEEQAKIDATPVPGAPAIEVAKIRSADAEKKIAADGQGDQMAAEAAKAAAQIAGEVKMQIAEIKKAVDEMRIKRDTDRDTAYVQAETTRTSNEFDARMRELEMKRELALLDYANKRELSLDTVKKELANTAMKLRTEKELAAAERAADGAGGKQHEPVIKPVAELPGKAPPGQSFTK